MDNRKYLSPEMQRLLEESERLTAEAERRAKVITDARQKQAEDYERRVQLVWERKQEGK